MKPPRVSIVIPTKDGAATLPQVLHALWSQRFAGGIEIIAVDSGSTDGTLDLLNGRADQVLSVAPDQFNHGLTRNLGIEAATGDLVALLVQDAVPQGENWLTELAAPLYADETIAGVFARQTPWPEASQLARRYHQRWIASSETPFVSALDGQDEWDRLAPAERHARCAFDNVCSCIRRSVWAAHPFAQTPIAEDLEWAREVLLAGYRIAFAPEAIVTHSHERDVRYEFERTRAAHERLAVLFGLEQVRSVPALCVAVMTSLVSHTWSERSEPERLMRAWGLGVAWPLGQYLGARRARATAALPAGNSIDG